MELNQGWASSTSMPQHWYNKVTQGTKADLFQNMPTEIHMHTRIFYNVRLIISLLLPFFVVMSPALDECLLWRVSRSYSIEGKLVMFLFFSKIGLRGRTKNRWVTINKTNLIKGKALEHKLVHWVQFQIQRSIIILDLRPLKNVVVWQTNNAPKN